jgi:hypothetical protein
METNPNHQQQSSAHQSTSTTTADSIGGGNNSTSQQLLFLAVGTEVSAKFKGAFCEARVKKLNKFVRIKVCTTSL